MSDDRPLPSGPDDDVGDTDERLFDDRAFDLLGRAVTREHDLADEVDARRAIAERRRKGEAAPGAKQLAGAVVVAFHDHAHLHLTLRRLVRDVAQVVVVELSDGDAAPGRWKTDFPAVETVVMPTAAGFGAALNEGMRRMRQDYVLAVHGDARLRPEAADILLRVVAGSERSPSRVAAAGPLLIDESGEVELSCGFRPVWWRRVATFVAHFAIRRRRPRQNWARRRFAAFAPSVAVDVDWVSGAVMMLRRDAFDEVGGIDERYFLGWGDVDYCLRLRRAGWRVVYDPRARAIHLDRIAETPVSRRAGRRRFWAAHGTLRRRSRRQGPR